jgi:hypothetical protein
MLLWRSLTVSADERKKLTTSYVFVTVCSFLLPYSVAFSEDTTIVSSKPMNF